MYTMAISEGLSTALESGFSGVQSDVLGIITSAAPFALGIVSAFIAVRLGIKFFKSVSKAA